MPSILKVFISATTTDLGSFRLAIRDALFSREDTLPVVQDHFPPDYRTVFAMLEDKIRRCDAMICLVGFLYGAEPRQRPQDAPRRSYTQLEFDIATRLEKPVYVFLASEGCKFDSSVAEGEPEQHLQRDYRASLKKRDQLFHSFSSLEELET